MGLKKVYADERICPVCGKEFICYLKEQWTYKGYFDGEKVFCSWTCMRKMEQEKALTQKRTGRRKKDDGHTEVSKADQD